MKILLLDVETSPNKAYIWRMYQEIKSTTFLVETWFILCWCAKWLDKKEMMHGSIHESSTYKKDPENDKEILIKLQKLLNEADIVIAHNGQNFDCKKIRTRFIMNDIKPASPYRILDTLKEARATFSFMSNRLNDLGTFLKVGKKIDTGGFDLWKKCLNGDKTAWKKMLKYCKQDVILLEKVYKKLRPFIKQHPNIGIYSDDIKPLCPKCGSNKIWYRGYAYTTSSKFRRFQCISCGGWGRKKQNLLSKNKKYNLTTNII